MEYCNSKAISTISKIIVDETQGSERTEKIFPLDIVDLGDIWLVKGAPYENQFLNTRYNTFFMHIRKDNCEILDIGTQGRIKLDADGEREFRKKFSPEQYEAVFGLPTNFDIDPTTLELAQVTMGGVVNTSMGAIEFAKAVLKFNAPGSRWLSTPMRALEVSHIWHVQGAQTQTGTQSIYADVLIFNRLNAKVLSFDP